MHRLPRLAATIGAALAIASCGGGSDGPSDDGDNSALKFQPGSDARAAAQTVEDFATAIRGKDWKRICNELYSAKERDLQKGLIAKSCEDEVDRYADLDNLKLTVTRLEIETTGTVQTETASGGEANFDLKKTGGLWKIDGTSGDFTGGGEASGELVEGKDDDAGAKRAVLTFDYAIGQQDWAGVCSSFTDEKQMQYTNCVDDVAEEYGQGALGLSVTDVETKTEASVSTRTGKGDGATFTLVREGGRWRIDGYGGTFGD
jgi:hypothetical protein